MRGRIIRFCRLEYIPSSLFRRHILPFGARVPLSAGSRAVKPQNWIFSSFATGAIRSWKIPLVQLYTFLLWRSIIEICRYVELVCGSYLYSSSTVHPVFDRSYRILLTALVADSIFARNGNDLDGASFPGFVFLHLVANTSIRLLNRNTF